MGNLPKPGYSGLGRLKGGLGRLKDGLGQSIAVRANYPRFGHGFGLGKTVVTATESDFAKTELGSLLTTEILPLKISFVQYNVLHRL